jgi:type IV pilus assembly protein PilB
MLIPDNQLLSIVEKTGVLTPQKALEVKDYAATANIPISEALIERDVLSDENLGILIADSLKIPFVTLSKMDIVPDILTIIPERFARKHKVIPFGRTKDGVKLAMVDPKNREVLEMVAKKTNQRVYPHLATERDIYNTLSIYRKDLQKTFNALVGNSGDINAPIAIANAPIAKIVDLIINYAYQDKASDVHIEPQEDTSLVRFRIDGILHDVLTVPKKLHEQILTRIKVLSRLRTDEHLAPQDGKLRVHLAEEDLDIRISILPIVEGEKVVMRLLASKFRLFSLMDLGMNEKDLDKVSRGIKKSYGMVLSTGPTGSGKTTSIYAILKILNSRSKNITTIEDPVEYRIKGINQIQVNAKTNLTFASGLRSILRQDPNIIFVGEIRDNETAGIAVNAALTGHLVVSTLHTNDAATALPRLTDMGVEPFLVASTVNVIIAQRLMRKICEMCKSSMDKSMEELIKEIPQEAAAKNFGNRTTVRIYQGKGCKLCHNTGYKGRVGAFEVLEVTNAIRNLITDKKDAQVVVQQAIKEGMTTMLDDGLQKVAKGVTTIEEVLRVTKVETA